MRRFLSCVLWGTGHLARVSSNQKARALVPLSQLLVLPDASWPSTPSASPSEGARRTHRLAPDKSPHLRAVQIPSTLEVKPQGCPVAATEALLRGAGP